MKNENPDIYTQWATVIVAAAAFPLSLWLRANYAAQINEYYIQFINWAVGLFS